MRITLTTGREIPVHEGDSIMDALRREKVYLVASCGGKGVCGKCRVQVLSGEVDSTSEKTLSEEHRAQGIVLACASRPRGDLELAIPRESRLVVGDKIAVGRADALEGLFRDLAGGEASPLVKRIPLVLPPPTIEDSISDLERVKRGLGAVGLEAGQLHVRYEFLQHLSRALREGDWNVTAVVTRGESAELVDIRPGPDRTSHYGLAVDVGTTTVVVYLVDVATGKLVDVGSTYNSQMRYGDDVINRIVQATEQGRLREIQEAVVGDVNDLLVPLLERHDLGPERVDSVVIAGNTTMTQLFYGMDPTFIREAPYIPAANTYPEIHAAQPGIKVNDGAPVYTLPCVASYVGGDIVAGVLASGLTRKDEIALFMDIGTNGEIVLGNREWLVSAACSAGPCFEGSGIRCGMRATEGAIEGLSFDPERKAATLKVIGDVHPIGICGSGMIDAIAGMFLAGILDQRGKFVPDAPGVRTGPDGPEVVFFEEHGRSVVLTEVDIENIMRAKAAIHAGYSLILREMGMDLGIVEKVYIAGGFGNFLDVRQAINIGMLPDLPLEQFEFIGNSSVTGSYLCLLSGRMRAEAESIASMMTYMELSVSSAFMDEYMSAMFLPHTDLARYPTVQSLLGR